MSSRSLEEVCEKIVKYVEERGRVTWKELLELGIPKATLSRALKRLREVGAIAKDDKGFYVLAKKHYLALIPEYTKNLCQLINCRSYDELASDLAKVGKKVEVIDLGLKRFTEHYDKLMETLQLPPIIGDLFKALYTNKGFFTIFIYEIAKLIKASEIIMNCPECKLEVCPEARNVINTFLRTPELLGLSKEVFENAIDVGKVLEKHGYRGLIKVSLLGFIEQEFSVNEMILAAYTMFVLELPAQLKEKMKIVPTVIKILWNYFVTGCRPLGSNELDELKKVCSG